MSNSYGIDLGTNNLKIYNSNGKQVTTMKNTIAIVDGNRLYSYGNDAYEMYEKNPEQIVVSFPIAYGVISEFDNLQAMVFEVVNRGMKGNLRSADVVVAVPTDITEVEKKAFHDLFYKTKQHPRSICLCEKPLAAALGMGLDATEPTGVMVVDFGADTTEISVISLGGLVLTQLYPFGGNQLDDDIVTYLKRNHGLVIGRKTACQLKETIASALPGREASLTVVGRDVVSGLPVEMEITSAMVYEGIKGTLNNIVNTARMILEKVPPELAKDVVHAGIYITGGSAKLNRLGELFTEVTNLSVNISPDADDCVARGLGKVISEDKYHRFGYELRTRIFK